MHDHAHDRGHTHGHAHHAPSAHGGRRLFLALLVTLVIAVVEAFGGWWSNSLALLGDAGHMLSDAAALGLAAFAAWIARRPPSTRHSYGLGRAETLAALINSLVMVAVVVGIVVAAIGRVQAPPPVQGGMVIAIALFGLLTNLFVLGVLSGGEQTLNTRGAMLHVIGDLLGSVAAVLSGAVIYYTGWVLIDPLLSLFIAALILVSTLRLLRESVHIIMEGVPEHLSLREVGAAIAGVDGVVSVHDLHLWTMANGQPALSAHVVVGDLNPWPDQLHAIRHALDERFGIHHVTLQPEPRTDMVHVIREPQQR